MEMLVQKLDTVRLILTPLNGNDATFILELVNTPGWLRFIGDRKVKTTEDAQAYIDRINKLEDVHYWVVKRKTDDTRIGVVTFLKRMYLPHFDIGFAFLPQFSGYGYAYEASAGLLNHLQQNSAHQTVLATTLPENKNSIKLLQKLGLRFQKEIEVDDMRLHIYSTTAVP